MEEMTNNNMTFDNGEIILSPIFSLESEMKQIEEETKMAAITREASLYRIVRIMNSAIWKEKYKTMGDFLEDCYTLFGFSRMTIYKRLDAYRMLSFAGKSDKESLSLMIDKPFVYMSIAKELASWKDGQIPNTKFAVTDQTETKRVVRDIIENINAADFSQRQAINYVRENYTSNPTLSVSIDGENLVVSYTTYKATDTGEIVMDHIGKTTFFADSILPNSIAKIFYDRIHRLSYTL